MNRIRIPLIIIMSALSLSVFIIFAWIILFGAFYSAFIVFLGLLVFLPVKVTHRRYWIIRASVFVIGLILLITTIHYSIGEVNNGINSLTKKPRNQSSLSSFSTKDKLGIYGLNVMMGLVGYPIYPEVSKETLMIIFPPPRNGIRIFHSDFAISSDKVNAAIRDFNADLKDRSEKEFRVVKRISWSTNEYSLGKKEARYALALNPSIVSLNASKKDSLWVIDICIRVKIEYPQNCSVILLSKPELRVEEGLFWVLQQSGWLFPYTAEWKFSINSNDCRIN